MLKGKKISEKNRKKKQTKIFRAVKKSCFHKKQEKQPKTNTAMIEPMEMFEIEMEEVENETTNIFYLYN